MNKLIELIKLCLADIRYCFYLLQSNMLYRWRVMPKYVEKLIKFDNVPEDLRLKFLATVKFDKTDCHDYDDTIKQLISVVTSVPENINVNWEEKYNKYKNDMVSLLKQRPDLFDEVTVDPYTGQTYKKRS